MKNAITSTLIFLSLLTACQSIPDEQIPSPTFNNVSEAITAEASPDVPTDQPEVPKKIILLPEPQEVTITAEDNQELSGIFFPAGGQSAPVIVLMHWYPGDQFEWTEIAYWLQNRGNYGDADGVPWKDPSWFPNLNPDDSYNVLTFTFRGCSGKCDTFQQDGWLLDAKAALQYARTLPGVDPDRVISIGASIGADGAIAGCAAALEVDPSGCLGALSFSPGNYLKLKYPDMVSALKENDPPRPAWCFFDTNDPDSAMCNDISADNFHKEGWSGGNLHGMHLITPNLDPRPLDQLLFFLAQVLDD